MGEGLWCEEEERLVVAVFRSGAAGGEEGTSDAGPRGGLAGGAALPPCRTGGTGEMATTGVEGRRDAGHENGGRGDWVWSEPAPWAVPRADRLGRTGSLELLRRPGRSASR